MHTPLQLTFITKIILIIYMFMNYILLHKYYYSVLQLDVKPPLVQLNVLGVVYTATSSFTTTYNFSVTKSDANILASNP